MPGQNRAGQSPAYRPPTTQGGNCPPPCSCVLQLAYCLLVLDTENVSEVSFRFSSVLILLPLPVSLSLPLLPLLLLFILFCFCCCFVIVNHRNVSWVRVCVCFGASRVLGFVVSTQNLHSVVPLPPSFLLIPHFLCWSPTFPLWHFCAILRAFVSSFLWSIDLARASRATWFRPPSAGGSKHSAYCKAFANLFSLPRLPTSIPPPLSSSWLRTCR